MSLPRTAFVRNIVLVAVALGAMFAMVACTDDGDGDDIQGAAPSGPLRIGYLADFSGALAEFGPAIQTGVDLAIAHINAAGGVHGMPVELVVGDDRTDPTAAVEEARRLIEVEGVHAIVGPLASGVAVAVTESVAAAARVPVITPSGTSPAITTANDDGYLFRSTTSDAAQGVVLAQLAEDEGHDNVGVVYINNAYGQGLAEVFAGAYGGTATSASFEEGQASYLAELQQARGGNADVLVVIGYPAQGLIIVREALENRLFSTFLFVDGTQSLEMAQAFPELEGSKGTAPVGGPATASGEAWAAAYTAEVGDIPTLPYIREAYDAVIAIALAAEYAKSNDGPAIRDALHRVGAPGGDQFGTGPEGVAAALAAVRDGKDIDFEGAATTLNWNEAGDVTTGYIGIWQYTGGAIQVLREVPFDLAD